MSNPYFNRLGYLVVDGTLVDAPDLNNPLQAIEEGFDKVDQDVTNCVTLDGTQTITGDKTFSGNIVYTGDIDASTATTFNLPDNVTINGDSLTEAVFDLQDGSTAVTQDITDNDTSIATTAFVHNLFDTLPQVTEVQLTEDETYAAITTETSTAGEALAFGQICYYDTGKWYLASSQAIQDDPSSEKGGYWRLGVCVQSALANAETKILLNGKVRCDSLYNFGAFYSILVLGRTPGTVVNTDDDNPPTPYEFRKVLGHQMGNSILLFNPSEDGFLVGDDGSIIGINGLPISGTGGGSANMGVTLSDGGYAAVVYDTGVSGEALSFGHLVYYQSGKWYKATNVNADQAYSSEQAGWARLGICVLAVAGADEAITVLLQGKVRCDALYPASNSGASLYVAPTAGLVTDAAVADIVSSRSIIRIVGYVMSAGVIYFNPASNYILTAETA